MFAKMSGVLVCGLTLVAGCATNQQLSNGRYSLPEKLPENEGVMVMKLVGMQAPSIMNSKYRTIALTHTEKGGRIEVHDVSPMGAADSVFAAVLPSGKYEVSDLAALSAAPGLLLMLMTSDFQDTRQKLAPFSIQPGTVTNLGTVAMHVGDSQEGVKLVVLSDEQGRESAVQGMDEKSRQKIKPMRTQEWAGAQSSTGEVATEFVRTYARKFSAPDVGANGEIVIGGPLGLVHFLGADGTWRTESVGTYDSLIYVRAFDDGSVFAGTDRGAYHLRSPATRKWTSYMLPGEAAAISLVEPVGQFGYAIQLSTVDILPLFGASKWSVILVPDLQKPENSSELLSFIGGSAYGRAPMYFDGKNLRVAFNHIGISRESDNYTVDLASKQASKDVINSWIIGAYRLPDGTQVMHRMNGMSDYPALSTDGGKTWVRREVDAPFGARFYSANVGYGLATVSTGWSTVTSSLSKTSDGGVTWNRVGSTLESGGRVAMQRRNDEMLVMTNGSLYSTMDDGATWNAIWPIPKKRVAQ